MEDLHETEPWLDQIETSRSFMLGTEYLPMDEISQRNDRRPLETRRRISSPIRPVRYWSFDYHDTVSRSANYTLIHTCVTYLILILMPYP